MLFDSLFSNLVNVDLAALTEHPLNQVSFGHLFGVIVAWSLTKKLPVESVSYYVMLPSFWICDLLEAFEQTTQYLLEFFQLENVVAVDSSKFVRKDL